MRTRALFAAGLAADCGSPARPHAGVPAEGVVPWADRPAAPYAEPGPRTFATDARPCRPAELRTSPGRSGVGLGNTNVAVLFTNRSAAACVLLGYPTVAGISPGGEIAPLAAALGSYFGDPGPPANIAPGQTAAVEPFAGGELVKTHVRVVRGKQTDLADYPPVMWNQRSVVKLMRRPGLAVLPDG
jgi:hypothetical protein